MEFIIFLIILYAITLPFTYSYSKLKLLHNHLKENNLYDDVAYFILSGLSPLLFLLRDGFFHVLGAIGSIIFIKYLFRIGRHIFFYIELFTLKNTPEKKHLTYDVALSFSGEDRGLAEKIANYLTRNGHSVFFDDYQKSNLWGKDL